MVHFWPEMVRSAVCVLKHVNNGNGVPMRSSSYSTTRRSSHAFLLEMTPALY